MMSFLSPTIMGAMCVTLMLQVARANPGESRAQIISRYGKPDDSYTRTATRLDQSGLGSSEEIILRFSSKDAPGMVVFRDGKCTEEIYSWTEDIGQKRIMEILFHYSEGRPWRATKLDYPDTQMVWRYTQPESNVHATYERNDAAHDAVYYGLTISR